MKTHDALATACVIGVGLIHLPPLAALAGDAVLQRLYGIDGLDITTSLLLQHRGLSFGLLAGAVLASLRWPGWRAPALSLMALSDLGFIVLVLLAGAEAAALQPLAAADALSLLLSGIAVWAGYLAPSR